MRSRQAPDTQDQLKALHRMAAELEWGLYALLPADRSQDDILRSVLKMRADVVGGKITPREMDAAIALSRTKTLKRAADLLCVTKSTLRKHANAIIGELDLSLKGSEELRGYLRALRDLRRWSLGPRE